MKEYEIIIDYEVRYRFRARSAAEAYRQFLALQLNPWLYGLNRTRVGSEIWMMKVVDGMCKGMEYLGDIYRVA